jgi:hypothetical protein
MDSDRKESDRMSNSVNPESDRMESDIISNSANPESDRKKSGRMLANVKRKSRETPRDQMHALVGLYLQASYPSRKK